MSQDPDIADAHERATKDEEDNEPESDGVSHNTQEWLDRVSGQ